jgi:hypothetical protein
MFVESSNGELTQLTEPQELSPTNPPKDPNSHSEVRLGFNGLIGHLTTAEQPEDLEISPEAQRITPQQRSYVALRVRGFSSAAACRQLNINQMAALRWSNSAWFEVACEEERNKWLINQGIDKRVELMIPLMPLALEALKAGLISPDERIRMAAVDKVFNTFFAEEKRPVGRPPKPREDSEPLNLSDIQQRSADKIQALKNTNIQNIDIRANA